ncbi:hypothetical protein PACTADRAFT_4053 [Pachysolen tannophilus NRRL Y-2460]|uniref:Uncharacterized protein n=1 Tax=Pachysolen tannophilus NRRL Y-2460 TaxID=669874 RepID=A0A1E4TQY6_PACTA|nr:hypothetical protein PACTADRAFT_4053 [Pachysolen tannophilus NRRL Y-2460]
MNEINSVFDRFKYLNSNIELDFDLYISIITVLIAKKNLLLSSTRTATTLLELEIILGRVLAIGYTVVDIKDIENDDFSDGEGIWIIKNLDNVATFYQKKLYDYLQCHQDKNVIILIENDSGIEVELVNELNDKILFRQFQSYENSNDNIDEVLQLTLANPFQPETGLHNSKQIFQNLHDSIKTITIVPEIKRYYNDIIIFLRNHRMVKINSLKNILKAEFEIMLRTLCVINRLGYCIPILVKNCAKKFFPLHLILISRYEEETSLVYGSDPKIVKAIFDKWDNDLVVEDALGRIQPPL